MDEKDMADIVKQGEDYNLPFGEPIDTKYEFMAFNRKTHDQISDDEAILFRAKDNALLPTLAFYQDECKRQGSPEAHIKAIGLLIMRVEKWRERNLYLCKVPD